MTSCGSGPVVVALSGGVDSSLVAHAALAACGDATTAVTVRSEVTPRRDFDRAVRLARHIGLPHAKALVRVLEDRDVVRNGPDRCYYCKRAIFRALRRSYGEHAVILDGTNAEDDPARPGLRAVREFGVLSPLRACGLDKAAIRRLAREVGLPSWDTPSESCLATRLPVGTPLSVEALARVEAMETFFHARGVETLRARHDNLMATVEHLPQYADIMEKNRDSFAALIKEIGLRSAEFKEWTE